MRGRAHSIRGCKRGMHRRHRSCAGMVERRRSKGGREVVREDNGRRGIITCITGCTIDSHTRPRVQRTLRESALESSFSPKDFGMFKLVRLDIVHFRRSIGEIREF